MNYLNPKQNVIDQAKGLVWNKTFDERHVFHPIATFYLNYIKHFGVRSEVGEGAKLSLFDIPLSVQNNHYLCSMGEEEIENVLFLCNYTQLLSKNLFF